MTGVSDELVTLALPPASIGLLGAGAQGRALLATLGIEDPDFEPHYEEMLRRASAEPAGDDLAAVSSYISAVAGTAVSWIVVGPTDLSVGGDAGPVYAMVCGAHVLVAALQPDLVEWTLVPREGAPHLVAMAVAARPGFAATSFRDGEPHGAALVLEGRLHTAAVTAELLDELASARTIEDAVAVLMAEV